MSDYIFANSNISALRSRNDTSRSQRSPACRRLLRNDGAKPDCGRLAESRAFEKVTGSSGGQRVLVVDDVDQMRTLIRRALCAGGYEVNVRVHAG
jgi:hypothetical protein